MIKVAALCLLGWSPLLVWATVVLLLTNKKAGTKDGGCRLN